MDKSGKLTIVIAMIAIVVIVAAASFMGGSVTGKAITNTQCSDRVDNDGDGRCDYGTKGTRCSDGSTRGDSGCSNKYDNTEASCIAGSTSCGVGECRRTSTCVNDQVSCTPGSPTTEICDNKDNDCDGQVDESLTQQCGITDIGACEIGTQTCSSGIWGACVGNIDPTTETCDGTIDEDCDGVTDEGCSCVNGRSQSCGTDVGACRTGNQTCSGGQWGGCVGEIGPSTETCNGADDDCDGFVDEEVTNACGTCGPVPSETCDGVDNDCDSFVDEGCQCIDGQTRSCGTDVGACRTGNQTCSGGQWGGCFGNIDPVPETCGDNIDNDCDGSTDEGCATCIPGSTSCGVGECRRTSTCVNDQVSCTPGSPTTEICGDNKDNDCDGSTDEGCAQPNSCSDTDGGSVVTVKGTVSGYFSGNSYSKTDFCLTNTSLLEYYCSSGLARNTTQTCGTNTTTQCSNGACV